MATVAIVNVVSPDDRLQRAAHQVSFNEGLERAARLCREMDESLCRDRPQGETIRHAAKSVGRNDPCPCGSGKKFKRCCLQLARGPVAFVGVK